jgi:molecular chaperone GrpE
METNMGHPNDNSPENTPPGATPEAASQEATGNARLAELEAQVKEKENKYLYLYAEFENYKKRVVRERSDLIKFGWENVARELVQVIDNLERALEHVSPVTDPSLQAGLKMTLDHFRNTLHKQGVHVIEALDKDFDPNLHEAVGSEPSEASAGKVIRELSRGYTLHGRLLRPAQVVVSGGNQPTG